MGEPCRGKSRRFHEPPRDIFLKVVPLTDGFIVKLLYVFTCLVAEQLHGTAVRVQSAHRPCVGTAYPLGKEFERLRKQKITDRQVKERAATPSALPAMSLPFHNGRPRPVKRP